MGVRPPAPREVTPVPPDISAKDLGLIETAVKFVMGLLWNLPVEGRMYFAERLVKTLGPELDELKRQGKLS